MPPTSTWRCRTTPPGSTTAFTTSPRRRRPRGKPPSAGTTSTRSGGSPKFERSEQRQRIERRRLIPGSSAHPQHAPDRWRHFYWRPRELFLFACRRFYGRERQIKDRPRRPLSPDHDEKTVLRDRRYVLCPRPCRREQPRPDPPRPAGPNPQHPSTTCAFKTVGVAHDMYNKKQKLSF